MKKAFLIFSIGALLFAGCSQNKKDQAKTEKGNEPAAMEATLSEPSPKNKNTKAMFPELSKYIGSVVAEMDAIPQDRKDQLKKITLFVQTKKQNGEPANLTFICTHNSRRSHMSQIWAATAAAYYGIEDGINTYSGGTEVTAFNPRAVNAIERAGFRVEKPVGDNPRYKVSYAENGPQMECFSKMYNDPINANENFAAVMTCSEADNSCPFIPGASLRVPVPYVDPKEADGTEQESATYDERCKQIATEMFYIMSQVNA